MFNIIFIRVEIVKSFLLTGPRSQKPKKFLDFLAGVRDVSLRQNVKAGSGAPHPPVRWVS